MGRYIFFYLSTHYESALLTIALREPTVGLSFVGAVAIDRFAVLKRVDVKTKAEYLS